MLTVSKIEHVAVLCFNSPKTLNALTAEMYDQWLNALIECRQDPEIRVVVMTGNGKYYTAGQALTMPPPEALEDINGYLKQRIGVTKKLIDTLIEYPKLLVAALNGPAMGFGVTSTCLVDLVYATPEVTFRTPFMELALCVEGCSTITFPRALGPQKATQMLLLGKQMTAQEWHQHGLVSEILPREGFLDSVLKIAKQASELPWEAVQQSLNLIRIVDKQRLLEANKREMELLMERMVSPEFAQVVMKFTTRKSKL
ncbi:ClpP/crotonase-like domain-containing protein [Gorgonomyces haynaldii]|nr:ClpP/crotonase-like domain-containing protein [Gorgonomyces haynaldii]